MNLLDSVGKTNINSTKMPRGLVWHFIGLPKRGKTHGASRFCPSGDISKVLYLDLEQCVRRFPQYNGLNSITITSYRPPMRKKLVDGKPVIGADKKPVMEIVPPSDRGLTINGSPVLALSMIEALVLIKEANKTGEIKQFETVVIDTLDVLQAWGEQDLLQQLGVASLGDIAHGAAWDDARKKVLRPLDEIIEIIRSNEIELVLLTHSKQTTQVADKLQRPTALRGGLEIAINGRADFVGYIDARPSILPEGSENGTVSSGYQRVITSSAKSEEVSGSRLSPLVGKTIPYSYQSIKSEFEGESNA